MLNLIVSTVSNSTVSDSIVSDSSVSDLTISNSTVSDLTICVSNSIDGKRFDRKRFEIQALINIHHGLTTVITAVGLQHSDLLVLCCGCGLMLVYAHVQSVPWSTEVGVADKDYRALYQAQKEARISPIVSLNSA